ncbi:hypothetical protein ABT237_25320 [Streptomyces sp. NPDC001581]|uniref:hypothetical protein n=1 Tax=Streptomyces sp. NPDC001581 TaxID=3154386 RepID=UPI00331DE045
MQASADEGKTVKVGCVKDVAKRAKALQQALVKSAPFGKPVTVHLKAGCTYTYPGNKKYFVVPDGRTIIGHGATLKGRTELQSVVVPVTSGSRITLQDLTLTGPALCVNVPASSHFTFRDVTMRCDVQGMTVADTGTADLLGNTELRGPGKATEWLTGGAGLTIERGGTVHLRDQAKITNWAVSTSMVDIAGTENDTVSGAYRNPAHSYHALGNGAGVLNMGTLTVEDQAKITGNKVVRTTQQPKYPLSADPYDAYKGGGIYNKEGATATVVPGSVTGNQPDQCAGPTPVSGCTN